MKIKVMLLGLVFILVFSAYLSAASVDVRGIKIPLIEGAVFQQEGQEKEAQAATLIYAVKKPMKEVISFYEKYLKDNNFLIIGGRTDSGFDAAVKKDSSMFNLKIYPKGRETMVQFIW